MTETTTDAVADTAANTNLDDVLDTLNEEKPSEEVTEKAETDSDKEPEKKVLVPHGAFHEERERRKELQKQLAEEKEARIRLEDRQNKILEMMAKKEQPQEEQFVDPLARMENKVNEVIDKVNKKQELETAEAKAIREDNDLIRRYSESAKAFSKDSPDFTEAYNYLLINRQKELSLMGFSDAEIRSQLSSEERLIVKRAYEGEKNPAEVVYALAKERGYKTASAAKKTIEDIDKGLKASKSLGSGGAKSGDKDSLESLTATDLAEMSQEEFDAFFKNIEKQANRKH